MKADDEDYNYEDGEEITDCPKCGYSFIDTAIHSDHHLCQTPMPKCKKVARLIVPDSKDLLKQIPTPKCEHDYVIKFGVLMCQNCGMEYVGVPEAKEEKPDFEKAAQAHITNQHYLSRPTRHELNLFIAGANYGFEEYKKMSFMKETPTVALPYTIPVSEPRIKEESPDQFIIDFIKWRDSESWQEDYREQKTHSIEEQLAIYRSLKKCN